VKPMRRAPEGLRRVGIGITWPSSARRAERSAKRIDSLIASLPHSGVKAVVSTTKSTKRPTFYRSPRRSESRFGLTEEPERTTERQTD
jgi:hypothetical protein